MDSEIRDTKNEPEGFVDLLNYWFQPFVKGMMFGIGHYITYKMFGPYIRRFFQPALKATN